MALDTVQDYVDRTRVLLQDQVPPYRYPDEDLIDAMNEALLIMRTKRPDIFLGSLRSNVPQYDTTNMTNPVAVDQQYRVGITFYMCGQAQLRDDEGTQDQRAGSFMQKFDQMLLTVTG